MDSIKVFLRFEGRRDHEIRESGRMGWFWSAVDWSGLGGQLGEWKGIEDDDDNEDERGWRDHEGHERHEPGDGAEEFLSANDANGRELMPANVATLGFTAPGEP
jgi:hypothetical protein